VWFLSRHFQKLNQRYHGPEGDAFAVQELAPVARRFLPEGGRVLEVGCGYGRNLVALAALPAGTVVGSDVAFAELARARIERLAPLPPEHRGRVSLVRQEALRLPFRDSCFDLVVLWQVLEHLFGEEAKRRTLSECVRVLKPGGHLLVETPNQWFPFDYHDNKLPLVHWVLPARARAWLTWKVRGMRYPPSEYLSLPGCERLIRESPGVVRATRATRVYFADGFAAAWRGLAGSQVRMKRVLFAIAAPLHAALSLFGSSADLILPSLRVVWKVEKRG
jgi:SAM-dependent methyltransferase